MGILLLLVALYIIIHYIDLATRDYWILDSDYELVIIKLGRVLLTIVGIVLVCTILTGNIFLFVLGIIALWFVGGESGFLGD